MEFISADIENYCTLFTQPESALLEELNRFTHTNVLMPRMLAGHLQGRAIAMISKMIRPKTVIEIGTYTGYSALCWAEGLVQGGIVHTLEVNDELESKIQSFFDRSHYKNQIKLHIGVALKSLEQIKDHVDIVYIDADKENYRNYFDAVIDQVVAGGFIIADNVLWSGKVLGEPAEMDHETAEIHRYNEKIKNDSRVEQVLLPIRDGLLIARKL